MSTPISEFNHASIGSEAAGYVPQAAHGQEPATLEQPGLGPSATLASKPQIPRSGTEFSKEQVIHSSALQRVGSRLSGSGIAARGASGNLSVVNPARNEQSPNSRNSINLSSKPNSLNFSPAQSLSGSQGMSSIHFVDESEDSKLAELKSEVDHLTKEFHTTKGSDLAKLENKILDTASKLQDRGLKSDAIRLLSSTLGKDATGVTNTASKLAEKNMTNLAEKFLTHISVTAKISVLDSAKKLAATHPELSAKLLISEYKTALLIPGAKTSSTIDKAIIVKLMTENNKTNPNFAAALMTGMNAVHNNLLDKTAGPKVVVGSPIKMLEAQVKILSRKFDELNKLKTKLGQEKEAKTLSKEDKKGLEESIKKLTDDLANKATAILSDPNYVEHYGKKDNSWIAGGVLHQCIKHSEIKAAIKPLLQSHINQVETRLQTLYQTFADFKEKIDQGGSLPPDLEQKVKEMNTTQENWLQLLSQVTFSDGVKRTNHLNIDSKLAENLDGSSPLDLKTDIKKMDDIFVSLRSQVKPKQSKLKV